MEEKRNDPNYSAFKRNEFKNFHDENECIICCCGIPKFSRVFFICGSHWTCSDCYKSVCANDIFKRCPVCRIPDE